MKILQLTKKFPWPPKDGESIAITNLARAFHTLGAEVTLLAMNTSKHFVDITELSDDLDFYKRIETVPINNDLKIVDAFLNLFSKESYHIKRFISDNYRLKLELLLERESFDVIQLETLYLAPYVETIRKFSNALVVMRAHNVEHEIWTRIAENTGNPIKKLYLQYLVKKLKRFEVEQLNEYDLLVPITNRDLSFFKDLGFENTSHVTPIGIDNQQYQLDYSAFEKEISISFIGSLDWMPNQEGLDWFLEKVWPLLIKKYPTLSLHIAGRNPPKYLMFLKANNVAVYGEVESAPDFINEHSVTIVPLLSGSGMRAKILEGMALGRVVTTTSIGLEGIDATHKETALIADSPEEFQEAIIWCLEHQDELIYIGEKAHHFVTEQYDNMQIAQRLMDKIFSILNSKKI